MNEQQAQLDEGSQKPSALGWRWPRWLDEIDLALPICSQFILYGNVHDSHLVPSEDVSFEIAPVVQSLWERIGQRSFGFLLVYEPSEGLRFYPREAADVAHETLQERLPWLKRQTSGYQECDRTRLPEIIRAIGSCTSARCGFVVEDASRLLLSTGNLSEGEAHLFAACERLARTAAPRQPTAAGGQPLFNPVFWLANGIRDLPDWFVVGNERIRSISIPVPDFEARKSVIQLLAPTIDRTASEQDASKQIDQFAALTEGLSLRSIYSVAQLARDQGHALKNIANAIRCYKVGVPDDPWAKPHLRSSIRKGNQEFRRWVKGQDWAIRKTLDILTRSVLGLSGAQAASSINRPRGVLFFAGPTGVGKTELAKAVSRLIFGDAQACVRFDMSEFSAEHSDARLIGAPPGYVGYDTGGELVNAVRQRPFSVLLFDEIEKAHPRILDKFLQILEDGRLTDGRGDTVHFSESILIFTSNLGMFAEQERGIDGGFGYSGVVSERVPVFDPELPPPYEELKEKVQKAISDHFRFRLERPELLNRIGDNIVVFDFIRSPIAEQIFEKAVANVVERVREVTGAEISLTSGAREKLLAMCTRDLSQGGRGIGNRLETAFINPLARALFARDVTPGSRIVINSLVVDGEGQVEVTCA